MRRTKQQSQFDLACAGLRATGARRIGMLLDNGPQPTVAVFERQCVPPDTRKHWYVTPDGRIWLGATFAFKQNPGAAVRAAILAASAPKSDFPTLEELGF